MWKKLHSAGATILFYEFVPFEVTFLQFEIMANIGKLLTHLINILIRHFILQHGKKRNRPK